MNVGAKHKESALLRFLTLTWLSICADVTVEGNTPSQGELDSVLSTAGLLSPTSGVVPATPRLSLSGEPTTPSGRGYQADPLTRWGSFTQEQLAAFG